jgi:hypothetical protein
MIMTKRRTLAFDVFLAENVSCDTVDDSECNGLPVGIMRAQQQSLLALTGMDNGHSGTKEQDHKHQSYGQPSHTFARSFHNKILLPSIIGHHNISDTTNNQ